MVVAVVQHHPVEGPGRIGAALDRAGRTWRTVRLDWGKPVPESPAGLDGLVVMGGPMGVADVERHPHLAREQDLLADALDANLPVLGVCLGSQLLAATLGAAVYRGPALEVGWHAVHHLPQATDDPLLRSLPDPFPALHWHGDVFDLPAGAVPLARSAQTAIQAFRVASAYGLLFHLEASDEQARSMAEAFPDDLAEAGVSAADLAAPPGVPAAADRLFDAWVALLH